MRLASRCVGVALLLAAGCRQSERCDAQTCPVGCCSAEGRCEGGTSAGACGRDGAPCGACDVGLQCRAGACARPSGGGGGAAGAGGGAGSDVADGGGHRCSAAPAGRPAGERWARERTTSDQPDDEPGAY
ncbi:MAG: hypothetical protein INH41_10300 [Myxococcaceae bacterium]|nr:hypothetical protein [Myxococcaceae bacterium]MCA3012774.1 hypothetical protein [Myxococcaceae bacterium]